MATASLLDMPMNIVMQVNTGIAPTEMKIGNLLTMG